MRIISGSRRGHKLQEFQGDSVRPTTDRVKESIFNLIQAYVPESICLDMFAGSGALALEAISRGAAKAVLIDKDKRSVDIIRKNVESLGFEEQCEIRSEDCFIFAESTGEKFDIIFLDPPYNKNLIEPVLSAIVDNELLTAGGIVVLESDDTDFSGEKEGLNILKQRRYGRTYITVYEKKEKQEKKDESSSLSGQL